MHIDHSALSRQESLGLHMQFNCMPLTLRPRCSLLRIPVAEHLMVPMSPAATFRWIPIPESLSGWAEEQTSTVTTFQVQPRHAGTDSQEGFGNIHHR